MLLSELVTGASVTLIITIEDKQFEFETKVLTKHKKEMLFVPIRKDEKLLNVQGANVSVDILFAREDDKPIIWQNTDMECVRYKHQIFYAADAQLKGKEFNRRGDYRLYIGEDIHARIGHNGYDIVVHLKDISNSGFAFIFDQDFDKIEEAFVYITYRAQINEKWIELPLYGKVVRKMPLPDGRSLYGCALVKKNEMIGHYINQKQMEQIAKKRDRFSVL